MPAPLPLVQTAPRVVPLERAKRGGANAVANMCLLPTVPVVSDHYHELAESISQQLSTNYCNVLLFVSADDRVEPSFSMTHLAQAFSLQSTGDVLLVDGDLHNGRLVENRLPAGSRAGRGHAGDGELAGDDPPDHHPADRFRGPRSRRSADDRSAGVWLGRTATEVPRRADRRGRLPVPETALLAAHCDAVYFLISRPHTKREAAGRAVAQLRASGANLLGCVVVND